MVVCGVCGGSYKSNAGLVGHMRHKHPSQQASPPPVSAQPEGAGPAPSTPSKVRFVAPRNPGLRIVVRPAYWENVPTPTGHRNMLVPGKAAEFIDGVFETDDPEIIDYLMNVYSKNRNNARFPIFCNETLAALRKG